MTETQRIDAIYDLSEVWKLAGEIFPYFEEKETDWDGAYREYLARVLCAGSVREFHLLMAEFLNLLGDGHTDYRFPAGLADEAGHLPFALTFLGGDWLVHEVLPGAEEFLLAKVLSVNKESMTAFLGRCFRYIYHVGNYSDWWKLKGIMPFLLKPHGNELLTSKGIMYFDLAKEVPTGMVGAGQDAPAEKPQIKTYDRNGKKVLYVRMDHFLYPGADKEILAALSPKGDSIAGVILDIRKNIGGMTAYAAKVAELFLSGEFSACQKKTRLTKGLDLSSASQYAGMKEEQIAAAIRDGLCTQEEVARCLRTAKNRNYYEYQDHFGAPGHRAVFDGPVVLLVGRGTISAAEDFTAMLKSTRRAVLVGAPTFGSTGTPYVKRLRLGGSVRICSVGYRLLDGTAFIGKGISPDILVEEGAPDYARGRDAVLEGALEFLDGTADGLAAEKCPEF